MAGSVIFHRLVQRDVNFVLRYYAEEAGDELADRFYLAFMGAIEIALSNPRRFYFLCEPVRRANIPKFPYHFLYREMPDGIRVLVLRHHKRRPRFGLGRT